MIDPETDWIVDSGCTSHMCRNKSLFIELSPHAATITIAEKPTRVTGIGTVKIRVVVEDEIVNFTLFKTLLVPSLPINLLSQSKLDSKFYMSTRHGFQIKSRETDELVMEARMVQGLYVVNLERDTNLALTAKESLTTWHERLGHIGVKHLKIMHDKMAAGIKFTDNKISEFHCDTCQLGKVHRAPIYNKERPRLQVPGEVVHWDVCGPMC